MTENLNNIREGYKRMKCKYIFNKLIMEIKYKDSYDNIIGNYEDSCDNTIENYEDICDNTIENCEFCICFELTKNKTKCDYNVCHICIEKIDKCPLCRKNLIETLNFYLTAYKISVIDSLIIEIYPTDYSIILSQQLDQTDEMDYLHYKLFQVLSDALPIHVAVFLEVDYSLLLGATYIRCYASHLKYVLKMVGHLKYSLTEGIEPLAVIGIEFQLVF